MGSVVGIVGDVRHDTLATPPTLQMYTSQAQNTDSFPTILIRSHADPSLLTTEARRAVWSVAPDVPVYRVAPLTMLVTKSIGTRRFLTILLELFGIIALSMTGVGVYGVIAHSVVERTPEIGIRMALVASRRDIVRLVMNKGLTVVATGLLAGIGLAAMTTRYLQDSLYAVTPTDPITFAGVALILLMVGVAAQLIPLGRAMRVDPAVRSPEGVNKSGPDGVFPFFSTSRMIKSQEQMFKALQLNVEITCFR